MLENPQTLNNINKTWD